ncbi:MAG TPA: hypothetical protein PLF40_11710, partial [Kofleriaceae bacterium]|nr:hypothetical protein [Kofleriaceae bacterium]
MAKVGIGASAGALATVVVAVGAVDRATLSAATSGANPPMLASLVFAGLLLLLIAALIRRATF